MSPFWVILCRLRRSLFALVVICWCIGGAPSAALRAQAPPAGSPLSIVDEDTRKQIKELKLKALEAESAHDQKKTLSLYEQILRLDPDDALARQQKKEIEAAITQNRDEVVEARSQAAKRKRCQELLAAAEDALIEARRTRAAEPVDRAQQALTEARKCAPSGDPTIERLQSQVDQLKADIRALWWELWGGVGLAVLGLVAALVFYFYRSGRSLEVIEGPQIGQVFALTNENTALGALPSEVDWVIEDPQRKVSRRHCDVFRKGRHYFVVDCSTNGTLLNGRPLENGQPALLKRGDRIGLGGRVTVQFR